MNTLHSPTRSGMSQVKLVIIIVAIVGGCVLGLLVGGGVFLVAVSKSKEQAKKTECVNNLRILGFALHEYQIKNNAFPSEGTDQPESFYRSILDFLEPPGIDPDNPVAVKDFLCPTRRDTSVGPKRDYGYGRPATGSSILGAKVRIPVTFVANINGTAKTALLSHLWMDPATYFSGADPNWNLPGNAASGSKNSIDSNPAGSGGIGSPHPTNPFLFADSHTQNIPYQGPLTQHLDKIWSYTNRQPFQMR